MGSNPGLRPLSISEFMCEIKFQNYHDLFVERIHDEETSANLQSCYKKCVKFSSHLTAKGNLCGMYIPW